MMRTRLPRLGGRAWAHGARGDRRPQAAASGLLNALPALRAAAPRLGPRPAAFSGGRALASRAGAAPSGAAGADGGDKARAYDAVAVEAKWRARWAAEVASGAAGGAGTAREDGGEEARRGERGCYYSLPMFPYPSGALHMGHVRVYAISDAVARFRRMSGWSVLHPIGWDAFGLPAENAALQRGVPPAAWTQQNIAHMRQQLLSLGVSFDWDREVATCHEDYYRWTQWLFVRLLKAGLAEQREATVNWDPVDGTVLANEQVDPEGKSWRSGAEVERRRLKQWFIRTTAMADELVDDLDTLPHWPARVKDMQANWIGRSHGVELSFAVPGGDERVRVFTTRADTLMGVTFMAVAHDHPLVERALSGAGDADAADIAAFVKQCEAAQLRHDYEPQFVGVPLGVDVLHPVTGAAVPVFVSDYVVSEYGSGAVMGVPAHDERDFAFAEAHGLPVVHVVSDGEGSEGDGGCFTGEGTLVNSGDFDGRTSAEAREAFAAAAARDGTGGATKHFKLRDWLVSRQRYWGAPVPVIHCPKCGPVPVPEQDLPVRLPDLPPDMVDEVLLGGGAADAASASPLARIPGWADTVCPCEERRPARRDTDTLDTFVDSSWYFLRFTDPANTNAAFDPAVARDWTPVSFYVGGIEHAILHLLYARFIHKFCHKEGLVPTPEPFERLLTQGMVLGRTLKRADNGAYLSPEEQVAADAAGVAESGVEEVWEKMSKSKHNGVDPADVVATLGADVTRLFTLFKAPPEKEMQWDTAALAGQARWMERLAAHVEAVHARLEGAGAGAGADEGADAELRAATHGAIAQVTYALESSLALNVAIAELMKLSNALGELGARASAPVALEAARALYVMLAPFAPHAAAELWERLNAGVEGVDAVDGDVHEQRWPEHDPAALVRDSVTVVLQVNGKRRGEVQVPADMMGDDGAVAELVKGMPEAQRALGDKTLRRVVTVLKARSPLVNFVV